MKIPKIKLKTSMWHEKDITKWADRLDKWLLITMCTAIWNTYAIYNNNKSIIFYILNLTIITFTLIGHFSYLKRNNNKGEKEQK